MSETKSWSQLTQEEKEKQHNVALDAPITIHVVGGTREYALPNMRTYFESRKKA